MKNFKKPASLLLSLVILMASVFVCGNVVSAAPELPETNTTLDCVNDYYNSRDALYDLDLEKLGNNGNQISPQNGFVSSDNPNAFVTLKVEKNSPFIAQFLIFTGETDGKPLFYVSSNAVDWTSFDMTLNHEGNNFTYYTTGIGEENRYVKIIICSKNCGYWHCDLKSISYNANTEEKAEMQVTHVFNPKDSNYWDNGALASLSLLSHYDLYADARDHGIVSRNPSSSYLVWEVAKNSPISIDTYRNVLGKSGGRTRFLASPDGETWEEVRMKQTSRQVSNDPELFNYYIDGIGIKNHYFKAVFCENEISADLIWAFAIEKISYNTKELTNTTLDFANHYSEYEASGILLEQNDVGYYSPHGVVSGGTDNSYITVKVQEDWAIYAEFEYFPDRLNNGAKPEFYVSENGKDWELLTTDEWVDASNTLKVYIKSTGANNKYLRVRICNCANASWMSVLKSLSYNKNTEPKATLNTKINFKQDAAGYNAALAKSLKNEGLFGCTGGQNGLTPAKDQLAYVVYEVEKGSPILAHFKLYASVDGESFSVKPIFFVSSDNDTWEPIFVETVKNGNDVEYYRDSIGAENKYVKIQLNDVATNVFWRVDFLDFSYNIVDPDGNGRIDASDFVALKKHLIGALSLGQGADFNHDGVTNIIDLICIKKYLL